MKSHTVKSAVFARGGGGSVTLASIQAAEVNDAGNLTTKGGDGLPVHTLAFYEAGTVTARVVCSDLQFARTEGATPPGADLFPGSAGVLTLGFGERVQGKGFLAGANDVQAIIGVTDGCVVGSMATRAQFEGDSTLSIDFTAISSDGATRPVAYSLATIAQATATVKTHTLKSSSFDPAGVGGAIAIDSMQSIEVRDDVNMNTRGSDGLEFHTLAWVDSQRVSGNIATHNLAELVDADLFPGAIGVMTLTYGEKALGIGFASTPADVVVVIGAGDLCVIGGPQATAQHEGDPSGTIPFTAVSADGATRPVTYALL